MSRSFYCNNKFKFLRIDIPNRTTSNCNAAAPHLIDIEQVKANPGNLFNIDINVKEREMMLRNERNASCEQNCWRQEDNGAVSQRNKNSGHIKTHTKVVTDAETLEIAFNKECNNACAYCCRENSSSWVKDLVKHGPYKFSSWSDKSRYMPRKIDITRDTDQKNLLVSDDYKLLIDEVTLMAQKAKRLSITGGEPLLNNSLVDLLESLNSGNVDLLEIATSLNVSMSRLTRFLEAYNKFPNNAHLHVSIDSAYKNYEFNRYGSKWEDTVKRIEYCKSFSNIKVILHSTITNLTVLGFMEFYNLFKDCHTFDVTIAGTPSFMAPHILDPQSKKRVLDSIGDLPDADIKARIEKSLVPEPAESDRVSLKEFLLQFTKRRPDLSLDIYPDSLLEWLEIK